MPTARQILSRIEPDGRLFSQDPGSGQDVLDALGLLHAKTGRRRIAMVGDSYVANNGDPVLNNLTFSGSIGGLNFMAGAPWLYSPDDIYNRSGGTLLHIRGRLPEIVSKNYEICFVQGCHNDFIAGFPLFSGTNNIADNYKIICDTLIGAGITPVLILGPPIDTNEGSSYVTLAQLRKMTLAANAWKREYGAQNSIPVWDWATPMTDLTASGGGFVTNGSGDTIHPGWLASFNAAKQGLADLANIIPPAIKNGSLQTSPLDIFDATYHPLGNFFPQGGLYWAGGGTVTNGTGTVALGLTQMCAIGLPTGGSRVASLVAAADGIGQWQQFAWSGATTGGNAGETWMWYAFISQAAGNYAPGDVFEIFVEMNVLANSPMKAVNLYLQEQNKDNSKVSAGCLIGTSGSPQATAPTYAWSGVLRTPPLTVPPDSTGAGTRLLFPQLKITFDNSANNASGTIQFRRWALRKVPPNL